MGFKENLKSELLFSGMLVKELAAKSGVNIHSLNNYINSKEQIPSVDAAVKIAQSLGVTVEYLVTGKEGNNLQMSENAYAIGRLADQLPEKDRQFALDFIKWLKTRH